MKLSDWFNSYCQRFTVNTKKLNENFYVTNVSNSSNTDISKTVHIRHFKDDKVYGHIALENDKLYILTSKAQKKERTQCSDILPVLIFGEKVYVKISNAKGKEITEENIDALVQALNKAVSI